MAALQSFILHILVRHIIICLKNCLKLWIKQLLCRYYFLQKASFYRGVTEWLFGGLFLFTKWRKHLLCSSSISISYPRETITIDSFRVNISLYYSKSAHYSCTNYKFYVVISLVIALSGLWKHVIFHCLFLLRYKIITSWEIIRTKHWWQFYD